MRYTGKLLLKGTNDEIGQFFGNQSSALRVKLMVLMDTVYPNTDGVIFDNFSGKEVERVCRTAQCD